MSLHLPRWPLQAAGATELPLFSLDTLGLAPGAGHCEETWRGWRQKAFVCSGPVPTLTFTHTHKGAQ